jgi:class 3 adenylate cyclase
MPVRPDPPADFEYLLDEMIAFPERRAEITARIHSDCARQRAVLVLDMCGFTSTTQRLGVVPFLLMIHRMRRLCDPCFREHGGEFVEAHADNLLFLFPTPSEAIAAGRAAHACIADLNPMLPEDEQLYCSIGIGFGEILCISPGHIQGSEVNLAAKLGEDIAQRGQILLTAAARAATSAEILTREAAVSISGLELRYYELLP